MKPYDTSTWATHPLHPKTRTPEVVEWIFLVDLLNFSFFSDEAKVENQFYVTYKEEKFSGYWSLCAAVNRALDAGIPVTSPVFWRDADDEILREIFRGEGVEPMPLLYVSSACIAESRDKRIEVLREAGEILCEVFPPGIGADNRNGMEHLSLWWRKRITRQQDL